MVVHPNSGAFIYQLRGLGLTPSSLELLFPCLEHGNKDTSFLALLRGFDACSVLSWRPGAQQCQLRDGSSRFDHSGPVAVPAEVPQDCLCLSWFLLAPVLPAGRAQASLI